MIEHLDQIASVLLGRLMHQPFARRRFGAFYNFNLAVIVDMLGDLPKIRAQLGHFMKCSASVAAMQWSRPVLLGS